MQWWKLKTNYWKCTDISDNTIRMHISPQQAETHICEVVALAVNAYVVLEEPVVTASAVVELSVAELSVRLYITVLYTKLGVLV